MSGKKNGLQPVQRRIYDRMMIPPDWTGITTGHTAECSCIWAPLRGVMQIKRVHMACLNGDHVSAAIARRRLRAIP